MSCIYDAIVIGGGTSGLACASVLKRSGLNVLVIEQGKPLYSRSHAFLADVADGIGGAGLFSDGKFSLFPAATNLWKMDRAKLRNAYNRLNSDLQNLNINIPPFSDDWIIESDMSKVKTESVNKNYQSIVLSDSDRNNLVFWLCSVIGNSNIITEHEIIRIEKTGAYYQVYSFHKGGQRIDTCRRLIISGGKHCIKALYDSMVGIVSSLVPSHLELGLRLEVESIYFNLYDHPATDVKIIVYDDANKIELRTFCCSRDGVVLESSSNGFTGFNGSSSTEKTKYSNIGIHVRISPDSRLYHDVLEYISRNGNTSNKISLDSFIATDSVIFTKEIDNLFKQYLNRTFHEAIGHSAILYYPSIENTGSSFLLDSELKMPTENIWVIGDATHLFRGILPAMVSGFYVASDIAEQYSLELKRIYKNFHIKISNSEKSLLVFTAQSKNYFYCRDAVCEFVFKNGAIPVNPFRTFDYFLNERVNRDIIRRGNNELVRRSDELWVFGPISDGVLFEIVSSQRLGKPIRFFSISSMVNEIQEIKISDLVFEPEVHSRQLRKEDLINLLMGMNTPRQEAEPSLFDLRYDKKDYISSDF